MTRSRTDSSGGDAKTVLSTELEFSPVDERETAIYSHESRTNTDTQGIHSHGGYGVVFNSRGDASLGTQTDTNSGVNKGDEREVDDELSEKKVEMMV